MLAMLTAILGNRLQGCPPRLDLFAEIPHPFDLLGVGNQYLAAFESM